MTTQTLPLKLADEKISEIVALHNIHGGVTFDWTQGREAPHNGYAVSIGAEKTYPGNTLSWLHVAKFVREHLAEIEHNGAYVGTWFDKDTGRSYIELSVNVGPLSKAVQLARECHQRSIFCYRHDTVHSVDSITC